MQTANLSSVAFECHCKTKLLPSQTWKSLRSSKQFPSKKGCFFNLTIPKVLSWKYLDKFGIAPSFAVVFIYKVECIFLCRNNKLYNRTICLLRMTWLFSQWLYVSLFLSWLLPWHKCSQATITSWNSLYPRLCSTMGSEFFWICISKISTKLEFIHSENATKIWRNL